MDSKLHSYEISGGTRNMLLENERKVIFDVKWQRDWMNCFHLSILQKAEQ